MRTAQIGPDLRLEYCCKGEKIPQIHVNEHLLDDIGFQKSIPFFSGTSSTTRKHNCNLEPFSPSEGPHASTLDGKFSIHVTVNLYNTYNTTMFTLTWQLLTQNTEFTERIMAIKKRVNHSTNKERCSARNLDDLLWKYCKSRYADLSCSDVHWNFWQMCNVLRPGSDVYNWYQLAISPIWRGRSTNV